MTWPGSRPTAVGLRSAVSTPHPLASRAALETMRAGGNAVDAAVVAAAVCVVVQPYSSSLAGVGWAAVHDPASGRTEVLEFSGTVPRTLPVDELPSLGNGLVDMTTMEQRGGALRGSLTTALACGWAELLATRGTWPLERVLAPATRLAGEGFAVSEALHRLIGQHAARLRRWPASAAVFLPGGEVPAVGARFVQRDLAGTLERVATQGADELSTGRTAAGLARFYAENGGFVGAADLAATRATWQPALSARFRGNTVHAAGSPLGDVAFLSGLQLLDVFPAFSGPDDPDYVHVSIETAKLVAAERIRHLGDQTTPATVDWLLSGKHTGELRDLVGARASGAPTPNPAGDTITLAVVDEAGNAVNLMQTVGSLFGTAAVAPGTGMLMNSSVTLSYPGGTGANRIRAGGKVEQNPCLAFLLDPAGRLRLVVGTPGGKTRVETVRQMLVNVVDFGLTLQDAVDRPRFLLSPDGDAVHFESGPGGLTPALRRDLEARGHRVAVVDEAFGTGQAVGIDPATGARLAAADRRLESAALAE